MKFRLSLASVLKSEAKLKIIKFLLNHEAPMSEREIASILKVSHMSVNRTMRELSEMNVVYYAAVGKAHLWNINRKSYLYRMLKRLVGSIATIPDPLRELKNTILKYIPKTSVDRIILYGSIAKNVEKPNSDIDIFILVKNADAQIKLEGALEKLSHKCLEVFGNRLSPYILTQQQFRQKQSLDIITEINQGIKIYQNRKA